MPATGDQPRLSERRLRRRACQGYSMRTPGEDSEEQDSEAAAAPAHSRTGPQAGSPTEPQSAKPCLRTTSDCEILLNCEILPESGHACSARWCLHHLYGGVIDVHLERGRWKRNAAPERRVAGS